MTHEHGMHHGACCPGETGAKKPRLNKLVLVAAVIGSLYAIGFFVPLLNPFRETLTSYFKIIWWAVGLGLLIGGVIERYVPNEYVSKILSRPGRGTVFNAVFLGFLMSACSHGILAIAIELHRKGASAPAVLSFLLASPWANLPLTILLFGLFGMTGGFFIVLGAITIALISGFVFLFLDSRGLMDRNPNTAAVEQTFSVREDIRRRWRGRGAFRPKDDIGKILKGSWALADMILWWVLIGVGLASLVGAYVPAFVFERFLGPTALGLLATLALAAVMEVCSEGTAPLAFEIYRMTGALGNSFVFLMGGVVTDYTEIGLVWHNIGRKTALWLVAVSVPQTLLLGWVLNVVL